MKQLIFVIVVIFVLAPLSAGAVWMCQPDYRSFDPYQNCLELEPVGVVGDSSDYNGPTLAELSIDEKRALLVKLEKIFNQII